MGGEAGDNAAVFDGLCRTDVNLWIATSI